MMWKRWRWDSWTIGIAHGHAKTSHGRVMGVRIAHGHVLAESRFCLWFSVPYGRVPVLSYFVHFFLRFEVVSHIFLYFSSILIRDLIEKD